LVLLPGVFQAIMVQTAKIVKVDMAPTDNDIRGQPCIL
jgi:hypothetical protein